MPDQTDPSTPPGAEILTVLHQLLQERKESVLTADSSYTAHLYAQGRDQILQKVGEEAVEVVIAGKNGDDQALVAEVADLFYHVLVMLAERHIDPQRVYSELGQRFGLGGFHGHGRRNR